MNKSILRSLAMCGICAASSVVAALGQHIPIAVPTRVTIPFNFTVGSRSFGAGDYTVRQVEYRVFAIGSQDSKPPVLVAGHPADAQVSRLGGAVMTFRKYGDRYFLSQFSDHNIGTELPKSRVERELAANLGVGTSVILSSAK